MFAVFENGSHQYRVQQGDTLSVDFQSEVEPGQTITFDRVLLANGGGASVVGRPLIDGAAVQAEVLIREDKGQKLEIQKHRRRKNTRRHTGHRQKYTTVRITGIQIPDLQVAAPADATAESTTPESTGPGSE